jgi:hypothetical protein
MRRTLTLFVATLGLSANAYAQTGCDDIGRQGEVMFVGSIAVDIIMAPLTARWYNEKHFALSPSIDPANRRVGLTFSFTPGARSRDTRAPVTPPSYGSSWKSPYIAFLYSALGTGLPILISRETGAGEFALAGALLGPGLGELYSGQPVWFMSGAVLRTVGLAMAFCG